jgi:hypothetical protein
MQRDGSVQPGWYLVQTPKSVLPLCRHRTAAHPLPEECNKRLAGCLSLLEGHVQCHSQQRLLSGSVGQLQVMTNNGQDDAWPRHHTLKPHSPTHQHNQTCTFSISDTHNLVVAATRPRSLMLAATSRTLFRLSCTIKGTSSDAIRGHNSHNIYVHQTQQSLRLKQHSAGPAKHPSPPDKLPSIIPLFQQ